VRRTFLILAAALTIASIPTAAFARTRRPAGVSCVDISNDGHCDAGDPALGPLVADGSFNASVAEPGWTPRSAPVGIVFDDFTVQSQVDITVTGDAHFADKTQTQHRGLGLDVIADNIDVTPKAEVRIGDEMRLVARRTLHVGSGAFVFVPGNDTSGLRADAQTVVIDDNARLSAGGMYSGLELTAGTLQLGIGVQFATAPRAFLDISAHSDIVATGLRVRGGDIDIEALWSTAGSHRVIALTNSTVQNTYTNSDLRMFAGPQNGGAHSPQDAIHFVHSNVSSHAQGHAYFDPTPS
jgi:hypothetical protein